METAKRSHGVASLLLAKRYSRCIAAVNHHVFVGVSQGSSRYSGVLEVIFFGKPAHGPRNAASDWPPLELIELENPSMDL